MKTTQGWGWLAAGVLALGLNGFYQDGGLARAHRVFDAAIGHAADRSGSLLNWLRSVLTNSCKGPTWLWRGTRLRPATWLPP